MPKGKLAKPQLLKLTCIYCGKKFEYYRDSSNIRNACYECIPKEKQGDAALLRRLIKKKAVMYKGNKCELCHKTYPYYCYDFHHINPEEKDFEIGNKKSTTVWEKVKTEIDKCELLCSNCHRIKHHQ